VRVAESLAGALSGASGAPASQSPLVELASPPSTWETPPELAPPVLEDAPSPAPEDHVAVQPMPAAKAAQPPTTRRTAAHERDGVEIWNMRATSSNGRAKVDLG
jgi:hypothetical protein